MKFKLQLSLLFLILLTTGFICCQVSVSAAYNIKATFPRLAGINIGAKNYDDLAYQEAMAKLDIVILGFYPGWRRNGESIRSVLKNLKKLNPNILLGQYTILNEASANSSKNNANHDIYKVLTKNNWWARDAQGNKVQWTNRYHNWDINITRWSSVDSHGERYPEWLAKRWYKRFFSIMPEFDIWYFDNVFWRPRIKKADWDLNSINDSRDDERIQAAYRQGHEREWQTARKLAPDLLFIGNAESLNFPEYKGKLQGALLEGVMGKSWSIQKRKGWKAMMARYHTMFHNTAPPHLIIFNVWGNKDDYRFFRYAFTSCLLDDGYFSFTDKKRGYSSVVWFDEYNINLGKAVDPSALTPWQHSVYKRKFQNGLVLVNPTKSSEIVTVPKGYRHILGKQDAIVNNGKPVRTVTISAKDGIVLIRDSIIQK